MFLFPKCRIKRVESISIQKKIFAVRLQHLTTPFPGKARLLSSGYLPLPPKDWCRWACEVELLKKEAKKKNNNEMHAM